MPQPTGKQKGARSPHHGSPVAARNTSGTTQAVLYDRDLLKWEALALGVVRLKRHYYKLTFQGVILSFFSGERRQRRAQHPGLQNKETLASRLSAPPRPLSFLPVIQPKYLPARAIPAHTQRGKQRPIQDNATSATHPWLQPGDVCRLRRATDPHISTCVPEPLLCMYLKYLQIGGQNN